MRTRSYELLWAILLIALITAGYTGVVLYSGSVPAASEFLGHTLGVVGLLLMLMTETLYSLRKRSRSAQWGRMSAWLQFHIVTGIVGPYLALLHTTWKFNGLAGAVSLMMVIVVVSGFFGRYIYTAVPRNLDGVELEANDLQRMLRQIEADLNHALAAQPDVLQPVNRYLSSVSSSTAGGNALALLGRPFAQFAEWVEWQSVKRTLRGNAAVRRQLEQVERLVRTRQGLRQQIETLAMARRMLAVWHTIHVPLGVVLFTAAFVHVGAALYYATLLR